MAHKEKEKAHALDWDLEFWVSCLNIPFGVPALQLRNRDLCVHIAAFRWHSRCVDEVITSKLSKSVQE